MYVLNILSTIKKITFKYKSTKKQLKYFTFENYHRQIGFT